MKFKRGILVFLALALLLLIISNSSAAFLSIQSIVESPWVNAALLFLLVFNFVLMIFRDVFRGSYGAAVIIAIVVGLGASLGVTYYFGAFLSKIGVWLLIIFVVAIAILVFRLTRRGGAGTGIVFWILGVSSVAWLAFIHKEVCPPVGGLPDNVCQVLDVLAIIILIICLIRLIKWVIKLFRRDNRQGQGRDGGRRRGENDGNPGNLTGYVRDRTTGTGISGASVEVHGGRVGQSAMTDASGHYSLTLPGRRFRNPLRRWPLRRPNYRVVANASGYDSDEYNVMINAGRATRQDFHLRPIGQQPGPQPRPNQPRPGPQPRPNQPRPGPQQRGRPWIVLFANGRQRLLNIPPRTNVNLVWQTNIPRGRIQIISNRGLNRVFQFPNGPRNLIIPNVQNPVTFAARARNNQGMLSNRSVVQVTIRGGPQQQGPNQPGPQQQRQQGQHYTFTVNRASVGQNVPITFSWSSGANVHQVVLSLERGIQIRGNRTGTHTYRPQGTFMARIFFIDERSIRVQTRQIRINVLPGLAHQGQLTHQPGQQQQGQANQQQNLRLREHYERQYLEKRREKERVQGEMRGVDRNLRDYMRQRATLQRELRQTRTHPELRGGIQIHLRDVNNRIQRIRTEMNRYKQRLRSLDSEMRALTSKMPRR